jgi:hypothetical protein
LRAASTPTVSRSARSSLISEPIAASTAAANRLELRRPLRMPAQYVALLPKGFGPGTQVLVAVGAQATAAR